MNRKKALELEKEFKGKDFNGYSVIKYINNGKSAAVFKAEKDGTPFALKIFDNELVENVGHKIQDIRIAQELSLKDHKIPNLIKIIDGGTFNYNSEEFHYMVMEFIEGQNLKEYINSQNYSEDIIKKVLASLYETCEELINQYQIAHRDIKPENIMISESGVITLMDLGVLKFIGTPSFSDGDEKAFVGTLRYAPTEFITRKETDDINGWKAINLYQIGGVLHDMITKKELFHDKNPYTNLVRAILEDTPEFNSKDYSNQLIQLTKNLFIKAPETRLKIATPLLISYLQEPLEDNEVENIIRKHKELMVSNELDIIQLESLRRTDEEKRAIRTANLEELTSIIYNIILELKTTEIIGQFEKGDKFLYFSDSRNHLNINKAIINLSFKIHKDLKIGFPQNFYFSVGIRVDESKLASISCVAFYAGSSVMYFKEDMRRFEEMVIQTINPTIQMAQIYLFNSNYNYNRSFKSFEIFNGIYANDTSFKEMIKTQIVKLLFRAKEIGVNDVKRELTEQSNHFKTDKIALPEKTLKSPMFLH